MKLDQQEWVAIALIVVLVIVFVVALVIVLGKSKTSNRSTGIALLAVSSVLLVGSAVWLGWLLRTHGVRQRRESAKLSRQKYLESMQQNLLNKQLREQGIGVPSPNTVGLGVTMLSTPQ